MRLLVAAGASGGGVYPALAVLQELGDERPSADDADLELRWVGGEGGMEADLVARAGWQFTSLPAAGLHGVGLTALPRNLWQLGRGYFIARRVLREFKPDALFFTGGFVAAPVALAGSRVPTLAFVPDIKPGFTLRLIARFADTIAVVAEESRRYFKRPDRVQVTGYPVRKEITRWQRDAAQKHFGLDKSLPTILVFGGSKGARSLNEGVLAILADLLKDAQVIHVSGLGNWDAVEIAQSKLSKEQASRYHAFPYLHDDMGAAFAAADLAVCRAGASTLGELPAFKLPAILVPIPFKAHLQHSNAAYLADRGAATIVADKKLAIDLLPAVRGLLADKARLERMRAAMAVLAAPDAAARIAGLLRAFGTPESEAA